MKKVEVKENQKAIAKQPKSSWKVNKEFDKNGNLIRYDSIYTWSSDGNFDNFNSLNRDSLLQSFKSKFFTNFSDFQNQGFEDVIFAQDSLFTEQFFGKDFFKSDFGKDFMDIDKITQQMSEMQKKFLEKYKSEFQKQKEEK